MSIIHLIEPRTERLQLRQWVSSDREPFAAMCVDPRAMEYFPRTLNRAESDVVADKCQTLMASRGWGIWVAETLETKAFIGIIGLHIPGADLPFSPCVEVLWRLAPSHWGHGYATEAGAAAIKAGFECIDLQEIVSFAVVSNQRSRSVMERLGMIDTGENFDQPDVPADSHLRAHCLYRISRDRWNGLTARSNISRM